MQFQSLDVVNGVMILHNLIHPLNPPFAKKPSHNCLETAVLLYDLWEGREGFLRSRLPYLCFQV